jgi:hypothetical protein
LAETVVIVLGVLIALGLDAWYGTIQESRVARVYLIQLVEDLRDTQNQMAAAAQRTRHAEETATRLLLSLGSDSALDADSLRAWLAAVQSVDNPVPVLGTAEALVSTGDLRLVEDVTVRAAITRWLSRSRDYWLVPLYQLEDRHRVTLSGLLRLADRAGVAPESRGDSSNPPTQRRAQRPPFREDLLLFLSDPSVYSLVADLSELKGDMVSFRLSMSREAANLRSILEPLLEGI